MKLETIVSRLEKHYKTELIRQKKEADRVNKGVSWWSTYLIWDTGLVACLGHKYGKFVRGFIKDEDHGSYIEIPADCLDNTADKLK